MDRSDCKVDIRLSALSALDFPLKKALERSSLGAYYDYLIELVSGNKWHQYRSPYKQYLLYCIKKDKNKMTGETSPHRLFFLVHKETNTIILLTNKKVAGNDHNVVEHLTTVVQCVEKIRNAKIDLNNYQPPSQEFLQPLVPASDKQSISDTAAGAASDNNNDIESLPSLEELSTKLDSNIFSTKLIINILNRVILSFNTDKTLNPAASKLLLALFQRKELNLRFDKQNKKFLCKIKLGQSSKFKDITLVQPSDNNAFIQSILTILKRALDASETANFPLLMSLLRMINHDTKGVLGYLEQLDPTVWQVDLQSMRIVLGLVIESFSDNQIDHQDCARFLLYLSQHNALLCIPRKMSEEVLSLILNIWASETISVFHGESPEDAAATSTQDNPLTSTHSRELFPIFTALIPLLTSAQINLLIHQNAALIDSEKYKIIFSNTQHFECHERLNHMFSLLKQKTAKEIDGTYRELLRNLEAEYQAAPPDIKMLSEEVIRQHQSILHLHNIGGFKVTQKPTPTGTSANRSKKAANKKRKPQKRQTHGTQQSKALNLVTIRRELEALSRKKPALPREVYQYLRNLSTCLSPLLTVDPACERDENLRDYIITTFITNFITEATPWNVLELCVNSNVVPLFEQLSTLCMQHNKAQAQDNLERCFLLAAGRAKPRILALLLQKYNINPNLRAEHGENALHLLFAKRSERGTLLKPKRDIITSMHLLLNAGTDIDAIAKNGYTPMAFAIVFEHDIDVIQGLLARGAEATHRLEKAANGMKLSMLDLAYSRNKPDKRLLRLLQQHGARLSLGPTVITITHSEQQAPDAHTELPDRHLSQFHSMHVICDRYLDDKSDASQVLNAIRTNKLAIDFVSARGTILLIAIMKGDKNLALALLEFSPNLDFNLDSNKHLNCSGTALHFAIFCRMNFLVPLLLERGCPTDAFNLQGDTALHTAATKGNIDALPFLNLAGVAFSQKTKDGKTLSKVCKELGNTEFAQYFLSLSLGHDNFPCTPAFQLRQAAFGCNVAQVREILESIDDINEQSKDGFKRTALMNACLLRSHNAYQIISLLVQHPSCNPLGKDKNGKHAMNYLRIMHTLRTTEVKGAASEQRKYKDVLQLLASKFSEAIARRHPQENKAICFDADGTYHIFDKGSPALYAYQAAVRNAGGHTEATPGTTNAHHLFAHPLQGAHASVERNSERSKDNSHRRNP